MPLVNYQCQNPECKMHFGFFYKTAKAIEKHIACKFCGSLSKRSLSAPTNTSLITVDNGVQANAVEIDLDMIEKLKERSDKGENRGD